jgi:hypothetical protein
VSSFETQRCEREAAPFFSEYICDMGTPATSHEVRADISNPIHFLGIAAATSVRILIPIVFPSNFDCISSIDILRI